MPEDRIRDHVEAGRRRAANPGRPPNPGDRITLYHRHRNGFGGVRIAEATPGFDPETITIRREGGRTLGVRTEALASWEREPTGGRG